MQLTGSKTGHLPGGRLSPDYQRIAAATLSMKGTGRSLSDKTQQSRRGDSNVTNFGRTMPNVVSNGRMDKLVRLSCIPCVGLLLHGLSIA